MNSKGILIIISGFSGAGKGTIVKELMLEDNYALSISATTREARRGEVHGEHYFFLEKDKFETMIEENALIEWAKYCDNYYGTPKRYVEEQLEKGKDVILEIEMQGALQIKDQFKDAFLVFVTAPTAKEIRNRLIHRGTETIEQIQKRLEKSFQEIDAIDNYDYIIVNDGLQESVDNIKSLIIEEHARRVRNRAIKDQLKKEFEVLLKGEL